MSGAPNPAAGDASKKLRRPTKKDRILRELTRGSLNRFEAERIGDHCLPSTVSAIQQNEGVLIDRHDEKVPTRFGRPVIVCRYSANKNAENLKRASAALALCFWSDDGTA